MSKNSSRLPVTVAWVLSIILIVGLASFGLSRTGQRDAGTRANFDSTTRVLDFQLPLFRGGTVSSADLRGKPAVINFYASWCTTCEAELPDFQAVYEQAAGSVAFIGVNAQSNDSDGAQARMIDQAGVQFPTARDRNDDLLRLFNTTGGLPTTLFIDAQGRVVEAHNGGYDQATLKAAIQSFLSVAV